MPAFGLMPLSSRAMAVVVLLAVVAGVAGTLAWQVQAWRFGRQLAEQARLHGEALSQLNLEQQLQASDQTHYRALNDAQRDQGRLRDRLATADLRLSVLLAADDSAGGCPVPAPPPPPPPAAWFMEPREPDLTRRMLNELSVSPMPATRD
ncbi:hypothetical protein H160_05885 [Pseudomonas sp. LAMO17WK12:I9]|nr:hypothetical protein H160_05885 [Pseudomonas sp. LAMO17WK12:I9]